MAEQIEQWMRESGVKRIARMMGGWCVYLDDEASTFGTGDNLKAALIDARMRA